MRNTKSLGKCCPVSAKPKEPPESVGFAEAYRDGINGTAQLRVSHFALSWIVVKTEVVVLADSKDLITRLTGTSTKRIENTDP